jgi:hypothetical protein
MQIENEIQISGHTDTDHFQVTQASNQNWRQKNFCAEKLQQIPVVSCSPAELPFLSPGIFSSHVTIFFLLRGRPVVHHRRTSRCGG